MHTIFRASKLLLFFPFADYVIYGAIYNIYYEYTSMCVENSPRTLTLTDFLLQLHETKRVVDDLQQE